MLFIRKYLKRNFITVYIALVIIPIGLFSGCCGLVTNDSNNVEQQEEVEEKKPIVETVAEVVETVVETPVETEPVIETPVEIVEEQKSIEDIIFYKVTDDMFDERWGDLVTAESADPDKIDRIKGIVDLFTSMYPDGFLVEKLDRAYVLSYLSTGENEPNGLYSSALSRIYVVMNPAEGYGIDMRIAQTPHEEVSSILLEDEINSPGYKNYSEHFDMDAWNAINPEGFEYNGIRARADYDSGLFEEGFLGPYAQKSVEQDFNFFAAGLLTDYDVFWNAVKEHERLLIKLNETAKFYIKIDSRFRDICKSQYEKNGIEWTLD